MSKFLFVFFAIAVATAVGLTNDEWCTLESDYCWGAEHIACKPNSFPASMTNGDQSVNSNPRLITLTQTQKDAILTAHNNYRNQLANGTYSGKGFPAAGKMGEMKWDDTLQYLAEMHAGIGSFSHDGCRSTPDHPYSGQNLFFATSSGTINIPYFINWGIKLWFDEIDIANPALISSFQMAHLNAGHFSVMVNDNNNRLGCGAVLVDVTKNGVVSNGLMLTCNYEFTNFLSSPTYVPGTPCQTCQCSSTYPSLCVT